jgi:hemin uptake protein HemP
MDERAPSPPAGEDGESGPRAGREVDAGTPAVVSSDTLFAGRSQVAIRHKEATYFLRQTRYGKLILTK